MVGLEHGPQRGRALIPDRQHPGLQHGWRYGMVVPASSPYSSGWCCCAGDCRDTPRTLGLPTVGEWRQDALEMAQQTQDAGPPIARSCASTCSAIPISGCSPAATCWSRGAHRHQRLGQLYMTEQRGFSLMSANSAISMFEVGGFIGALVAGWGIGQAVQRQPGPMNLIFAMGYCSRWGRSG